MKIKKRGEEKNNSERDSHPIALKLSIPTRKKKFVESTKLVCREAPSSCFVNQAPYVKLN